MGLAKDKLNAWLQKHNARGLWSKRGPGDTAVSSIECWDVHGRVVVVFWYGDKGRDGWEMFTAFDSISIDDSLADAEERVGLRCLNCGRATHEPAGVCAVPKFHGKRPPIVPADWACPVCKTPDVDSISRHGGVTCANGHVTR